MTSLRTILNCKKNGRIPMSRHRLLFATSSTMLASSTSASSLRRSTAAVNSAAWPDTDANSTVRA